MDDLRILVTTDSEMQSRTLAARLQDGGWSDVEVVLGGDAAIEQLGASEYDLVIAQWRMQGGDGEKLVRWIRDSDRTSRLPLIAVADDEGQQGRQNEATDVFVAAVCAGVSDYIEMPFLPEALKKKVLTVAGASSHLMPAIYGEAAQDWDELPHSRFHRLYAKVHPRMLLQEDIDAVLTAADGSATGVSDGEARQEDVKEVDSREAADSGDLYSDGVCTISSESTRIVASYDFKHPARVNKDQLRTIENLHDSFARLLSSTFSNAMRTVVDVDTAFVDQTTYAEFIASLSNPSCSYQFTLGPTNGSAIIDIAMPVVCAFVDRIFGGKGSSQGMDARTLSRIEMGVIARILKRMVEDLEATWEPVLPVRISDIELETIPEFMQITAASEIVILLAFEVNSTNASGLISLCYPFFTLEPILPLLGRQTFHRLSSLDAGKLAERNRLRLGAMQVPVTSELGRTRITAGEASELREGDVIRLATRQSDPVRVFVGGVPKFLGWPYEEEDGEMKLRLAGRIPAHLQGKYGRVGEA